MVAIAQNPYRSTEYPAAERGSEGQGNEPVIDLVHLSRQTLSDEALERELLGLFERQSARIVAQLNDPGAGDSKIRGDLAHTLRGSALAIGATRVARSAQIYETHCATAPRGAAVGAPLAALADAVAEARATIAQLLS